MQEYYVLTRDPNYITVGRWLAHRKITVDIHLNRTRFWIPDGPILTEFLLRFSHCTAPVLESESESEYSSTISQQAAQL